MPTIPLTDISIRNLKKPKSGQITYYDKSLPGFGVRISLGGTKTFTLVFGANRKRETLGRVGILSLADARKEAKRVLAEHTLGHSRPVSITWDAAKQEWLDDCKEKGNKERTTKDYKRYIDLYFKFGRTPFAEVTQEDIVNRLKKLNDRPSEKLHAFVTVRRMIRWGKNKKYVANNPMDGLVVPPEKSSTRTLTITELREVLRVALQGKNTFARIVAVLILTGQRRTEIGSLEHTWVHDVVVTLPETITKNGREHMFPICKTVEEVLASTPKSHDVYVFPAGFEHRNGKPTTHFNGWSKSKLAFDKELQGVAPWTLHDLRRTFSTMMAELEVPIHVTEKLLNHVSGTFGGVVGTYNRYSYMKEMREAVAKYEKLILG